MKTLIVSFFLASLCFAALASIKSDGMEACKAKVGVDCSILEID